jgi:hypothetical protein
LISNSQNPAVAAISIDPFLINFISPSSNAIFAAPAALDATPILEVGPLNNHVVTHQNSRYTLSATEYVISFDTTTEVPAGGKIVFTFPDNRIWRDTSTTLAVTYGTSFGSTESTVVVTYDGTGVWVTQISLDSICASTCPVASYQFKLAGGIKNPDTVETLTGNFVSYTTDSAGAVINRDIKLNSDVTEILPTLMTATIVRNVVTVGLPTNLTVAFTTANPFPSGGKIIFKMPTDQIAIDSTIICQKGDLSSTIACSQTTSGSYYVITLDEWCTSSAADCAAGTSLSFIIEGTKNPSLLSANIAATSWEVLTASSSSNAIDGAYTSLKPTPDLEGIAVTISTLEVASLLVYAQTTMSVLWTPNSDLPSNAQVEIGIPSEFALAPTTTSCTQSVPSSATLSCSYTYTGGYLTSILVTNPCTFSNCLSATSHLYTLAIRIRENTKGVGGSFSVTTKTSTEDIGLGSFTNAFTILPNPFVTYSYDNSNCDTVGAACSLIVKFTTVYTFPNKVSSGKVAFTIPSDLTINSSGCIASIAGNSMECARVGTSVTATHSETSSVAGQEISVTFTSITNPTSTSPTNTFVIYTQEQISGTYYSIDGIDSGFTYAVSTLASITDINVTRDAIDGSNNGYKVNRNTHFLFKFVIPNEVATDGTFTFVMPVESDAQIDTAAGSTTCRASDCASGATVACTATSSTRTVLVTDY